MSNKTTFGKYFVKRLYDIGIKDIFAVPGDFNLLLCDELVDSDINFIGCCNELNAAYAADGYARMNQCGAVLTTYNVGEFSAINGIAGAFAEDVPVIKIGGIPKREFFDTKPLVHHTLGDYNCFFNCIKNITCDAVMINDPKNAVELVERAITNMFKHSKPIYIGVCSDMVNTEVVISEDISRNPKAARTQISNPEVLEEMVSEIVKLVSVATKPLLILGYKIARRGCQYLVEKLIDNANIPYITMLMDKAIISEDNDNFLGMYSGPNSEPHIIDYIESSDCVIAIGTLMSDFNSCNFALQIARRRYICIDSYFSVIHNHKYEEVYLHDILEKLSAALIRCSFDSSIVRRRNLLVLSDGDKEELANQTIKSSKTYAIINRLIVQNSVVIVETGSVMFDAYNFFFKHNVSFIAQVFYGSIGFSVGAALGTSIQYRKNQRNKRTFLFVGDGSLQVTVQEISTMIRNKCNTVVFCINNDGYTIERVITDNVYNDIQMWNYSQLPSVFGGGHGFKVTTYRELFNALEFIEKNVDQFVLVELCFDRFDCSEALKVAGSNMAKNNKITFRLHPTYENQSINGLLNKKHV